MDIIKAHSVKDFNEPEPRMRGTAARINAYRGGIREGVRICDKRSHLEKLPKKQTSCPAVVGEPLCGLPAQADRPNQAATVGRPYVFSSFLGDQSPVVQSF
jgi:hypothetical protein